MPTLPETDIAERASSWWSRAIGMTPDDERARSALLVMLALGAGFALGWILRGITAGASEGASAHLDLLSRDELYARARAADVPGRSTMRKDELVDALRAELEATDPAVGDDPSGG
jgi:hypothetical protein